MREDINLIEFQKKINDEIEKINNLNSELNKNKFELRNYFYSFICDFMYKFGENRKVIFFNRLEDIKKLGKLKTQKQRGYSLYIEGIYNSSTGIGSSVGYHLLLRDFYDLRDYIDIYKLEFEDYLFLIKLMVDYIEKQNLNSVISITKI